MIELSGKYCETDSDGFPRSDITVRNLNRLDIIGSLDYVLSGLAHRTGAIEEDIPGEYAIIIGGAAMVLHGITTHARDIDIVLSDNLYDYLQSHAFCGESCCYPWSANSDELILTEKIPVGSIMELFNSMELFKLSSMRTTPHGTSLREMAGMAEEKWPGVPLLVQTPESILAEKVIRGRKKDIDDIPVIKEFIKEQQKWRLVRR